MSEQVAFPSSFDGGHTDGDTVKRHQLLTRTIAILAGVACSTHRLAIQSLITQKGFEILSGRVESWSFETDQDFLSEFLRDEDEERRPIWMSRLTGASIYVMILERHDAAATWLELCGPDVEGENASLDEDGLPLSRTGLRARYGTGALYGSSEHGAPRQIAICFPDLASYDALDALHAETKATSTYAATSSSGTFLVRENEDIIYDENGKAYDAHSGEALELQSELIVDVRSPVASSKDQAKVFKARPMPSSTKNPIIQPRLSKAAALRMGVALPEAPKRTMSIASSNDGSLGISGLPRTGVQLPKSLMAPSIAPRLNRVAATRTKSTTSCETESAIKEKKPVDFSNTPGHKRASLSASRPASLAAPTLAPRLNKAATARLTGNNGAEDESKTSQLSGRQRSETSTSSIRTSSSVSPTATRKPIDFSNTPGHKRMSMTSSTIKSLQAPTLAPRANRASESRTSGATPMSRLQSNERAKVGVVAKVSQTNKNVKDNKNNGKENEEGKRAVDYSNTPGHKRHSTGFAIASLAQPTIVPRINTAAKKRMSMGAVPPSSDPRSENVPRPRSVLGGYKVATSVQARSGSSMSSAHQDGVVPRLRAHAAPPTSFRL